MGTSITVGVPAVSSGSINTSVTASKSYQYGMSDSKANSIEFSFPVTAPAYTIVDAVATIHIYKMSVHYEAVFKSRINNATIIKKGVWDGVQASHVSYSLSERPYGSPEKENVITLRSTAKIERR